MTGYESKRAAAQDKLIVTDIDGHVVRNARKPKKAQPAQEPVAWPCVIAEADFSENTVTLAMQCTDYKVSAGKHWLSTTPPQRPWVMQREWVDLTEDEIDKWAHELHGVIYAVMAELKEKNNG